MFRRLRILTELTQDALASPAARLGRVAAGRARALSVFARRERVAVTLLTVLAGMAYGVARHPPLQSVGPGEMVVRRNRVTGEVRDFSHGNLVALPGVHEVRRYSLREQVYRARQNATVAAASESPFRTVEGLPLSVDVAVRYAIDPLQIGAFSQDLPNDLGAEVLRPALREVIVRLFGGYTAREVITTRRADIERALAVQLRPRLAAVGLKLHGVELLDLDLPPAGRAAAKW
jgi:regulator of protease activity HflC (stomatin/prohibitin superfamily)